MNKRMSFAAAAVALLGAGAAANGAIAVTDAGTTYALDFNNLNTNFGGGYNATGGAAAFPTNTSPFGTAPVPIYNDNGTPTFTVSGTDFNPGGVYSNSATYSNSNSYRALQDGSGSDLAIGIKDSNDRNYVLRLTNNTGQTITSVDVSYAVEQYSTGAAATQVYLADYSVNEGVNFITTGLSGVDPYTSVTTTTTDGNLTTVASGTDTATITESIAPGGSLWIRWFHDHPSGTSNHVGLDDISVTAAVPEPASIGLFAVGAIGLLRRRRR